MLKTICLRGVKIEQKRIAVGKFRVNKTGDYHEGIGTNILGKGGHEPPLLMFLMSHGHWCLFTTVLLPQHNIQHMASITEALKRVPYAQVFL